MAGPESPELERGVRRLAWIAGLVVVVYAAANVYGIVTNWSNGSPGTNRPPETEQSPTTADLPPDTTIAAAIGCDLDELSSVFVSDEELVRAGLPPDGSIQLATAECPDGEIGVGVDVQGMEAYGACKILRAGDMAGQFLVGCTVATKR